MTKLSELKRQDAAVYQLLLEVFMMARVSPQQALPALRALVSDVELLLSMPVEERKTMLDVEAKQFEKVPVGFVPGDKKVH